MATYTVQERGRHERPGRPYTFGGTLEVVHTRDGGARPEHVLVYRRDDGRRVVEFRTGGPGRGGGGGGDGGGRGRRRLRGGGARGFGAGDRRGLRRAAGSRRGPAARARGRRGPAPLSAAGEGGMVRSRHGGGGGTLIGAAIGYVAARSLDPRYDQGAMVLGIAAACCLAFGPEVWSFLRGRLAARG